MSNISNQKLATIQEIEERYTTGVYTKKPVEIVRGKGSRVWDSQGKEYIDCATGIGVAAVGHANEYVAKAIAEQAHTLMTCPDAHYYNDKRAKLLEKLSEIAPGPLTKSFLCNSGTEAVEAAIKFARGFTGKTGIIAAMRSFHGRTLGALSATWKEKYRKPFEPLVPGFKFVPYGNLAKLEGGISEDTAAVILEPIQGEGGVFLPPPHYFKEVRALCDRRGVLLIIDEIQTGFGRTGKMFACEHFSIEPDIMCVAKAMGGGFPVGAAIMREEIKLNKGLHGSTFGGNPLACAAALATIEYIQKHDLPKKAAENGAYFLQRLKEFEGRENVRETRGLGLMLALQLKAKSGPYLLKLIEKGILALPAGNTVIRFLPPLEITKAEIDQVIVALDAVLREKIEDNGTAEEDA